jgi:hypothetical protein
VALGLAAVAVALLSKHLVFPAYSWNRDESVYLWQVAGLRTGQFTSPTGSFSGSFHPWLAGIRGHSFFSQYTLGWPLVLFGADVLLGSPDAALALGAALTVVGTYLLAREITEDHRIALAAGVLMLASPIVIIQSGIYLGYLFTLGLGLLFATATLSGFRTGRRGRLVVAGALVGWIFMTRPFDAVVWAVAVVGCVAWGHRRTPRVVVRSAVALALGFVPLLIATLLYNQHVTGAFGQFPITAADPLDTFGFGQRRIMPTFPAATYSVWQGVRSSAKQGVFLPIFMTGSYLLAGLGLWGLWRRRRELGTRVLIAIMVGFPLGYFFFWGMYVSSPTMPLSGPIYYIPLYAVLVIAGARDLVRLWDTRRRVATWLVIGIVLVTIPLGFDRVDVNRRISEAQLPWKQSSASVPRHSLVFVWRSGDYLMFLNPYSANRPNLDGPVLYATDQGSPDLAVMAAYPHRTAYLQRTSLPPDGQVPNDHPKTPVVTLVRVQVVRGSVLDVRTSLRPVHPSGLAFYSETGDAPAGSITSRRFSGGIAHRLDAAALGDGLGTISIGVGRGATASAAAQHPLLRQDIHYRVAEGRVEVLTPIDTFRRTVIGGKRHWVVVAPGVTSSVSLATVPVPLRK